MPNVSAKFFSVIALGGAALLAACGGSNTANEAGNTATTEMLSTDTTLDGTTNDATSMDAAAGNNADVAADTNTTGNTAE